jgi:hypothetical protein
MLALNALSWAARGTTTPQRRVGLLRAWTPGEQLLANATDGGVNSTEAEGPAASAAAENDAELMTVLDVLAYAVLVASWILLITMAVFFVVFVVFRGAQLQKMEEDAAASAEEEEELVSAARAYVTRRAIRTSFSEWRRVVAESCAARIQEASGAAGRVVVSPARRASIGIGRASGTLPSGWLSHVDADGNQFFHHAATNTTQWSRPTAASAAAAAVAAAEAAAPAGVDREEAAAAAAAAAAAEAAVEALHRESQSQLPPGWSAVVDARTGQTYYVNAATGETSWSVPRALPHGWVAHTSDASGATYYHNASTGATSWTHPADDAPALVGGAAAAAQLSNSGSGSASGSGKGEGGAAAGGGKTKKRRKQKARTVVQWNFVERDDISLVGALLGEATVDALASSQRAAAVTARIPPFLSELYTNLFEITNRSGSGYLSTIELTTMLRTRAKDTGLNGDAAAIFTLKTLLATQGAEDSGDHGAIGPAEFASGLTKALLQDPNGHVAQWILLELQEEAARWSAFEHDAKMYYVHSGDGAKTWTMPPIVEHMERAALLLGGGAATASV